MTKVKDDSGHEHGADGKFTSSGGGGSSSEESEISSELADKTLSAADAVREKYGDEASCGDIANAVYEAMQDSGHDIKMIDDGAHVYVVDYTTMQLIDHAKETTDRGGDEIMDFDDARSYGYKIPDNVPGAKTLEIHGKKIVARKNLIDQAAH